MTSRTRPDEGSLQYTFTFGGRFSKPPLANGSWHNAQRIPCPLVQLNWSLYI